MKQKYRVFKRRIPRHSLGDFPVLAEREVEIEDEMAAFYENFWC